METLLPTSLGAAAAPPLTFNFDAQGIRVIGTPESPQFVARDVCEALGIGKYRDAISFLDDDEKGCPVLLDTLGGPQEMATVNESGLYALIFRSRKQRARAFRRWVTNEVLPAIRRTGAYAVAPATDELSKLTAEVRELRAMVEAQAAAKARPLVVLGSALRPQAVVAVLNEGPLSYRALHRTLEERHGHVPKATLTRRLNALSGTGEIRRLEDGRWSTSHLNYV